MKIDRILFSERLKLYMDDRGISKVDLAKRLNTTKQTAGNWVNRVSSPSLDVLPELAGRLGVSLWWLMGVPGMPMNISEEGREVDELMQKKIEDQMVMDAAPKQEVNGSIFPVYTEEQLDKRMAMLQQAMDMFAAGKITQEMLELLVRSLR